MKIEELWYDGEKIVVKLYTATQHPSLNPSSCNGVIFSSILNVFSIKIHQLDV